MTSLDSERAPLYRKDTAATQALAVVIVSYHTGDALFTALESVCDQSLAPFEIVVVDNGNPASVRERLNQLATTIDSLSVLSGHGNLGFAAGCNLGASHTTAPQLLFLNPDCVLPIEALAQLMQEYAQLPPRSLIAPLLLNEDYTEQRGSRRAVLTPWRAAVEWLGLYHLAPSHPYFIRFNRAGEPLPLNTHRVDVTSGAAMMLSRSLFLELKGFDEGYFLHVEDIDLCVTLLKRGGATFVAPSVRVVHQGGTSTSSALKVEWHKARGFCRYFYKHFKGVYPPGFLAVISTLVWLRLAVRAPMLMVQRSAADSLSSFDQRQNQASADSNSITPQDAGD